MPKPMIIKPETRLIMRIVLPLSFVRTFATAVQRKSHQISEPRKMPSTVRQVVSLADSSSLKPKEANTAMNEMMVIGFSKVSIKVLTNAENRLFFSSGGHSSVHSRGAHFSVSMPILSSSSAAHMFIRFSYGMIAASADVIETAAIKP